MSIPPNSLWRGCAANFPQPVTEEDERAAQFLVETVYYFNCRIAYPPLPDIEYRSSGREEDILRHVFRWDNTPYQEVFENGFRVRRQQDTPDEVYFCLDHYVHHGGRPLDTRRTATHAFISTTINSNWFPVIPENENEVTRYEIYAPGGIWIAETLGDRYRFRAQDEVSFPAGIARQYILSAQRFRRPSGRYRGRELERVDNELILSRFFNPQSHPTRLLDIQNPICEYCLDRPGTRGPRGSLTISIWPPCCSESDSDLEQREKREASSNSTRLDWYTGEVAKSESYDINAAFRSSCQNEAYVFMKNEYVLLNYAPASKDDRVVNGPLLICDGFPSLTGTAFAEHGIDCAFGSHTGNQAFIFSGNLCAQINYSPGTTDDKIIKGPMTITAMFPFLKRTVFENGIDAAFESSYNYDVTYLFKDDQYALINYVFHDDTPAHLVYVKLITDGFPSLKNTIFESGMDAAFASHKDNEAYLFKGDSYARFNFAPPTTDDYIIDGVKKILPNWPSLQTILPRKNSGIDVHNHTAPHADIDDRDEDDHEEL